MRSFLLLLVLVFVAITSSNALLTASHRHQPKTAKLKLDQAVQWNIEDKRFLRATDAADEERGLAGIKTKLKAWLEKFTSLFKKSKSAKAAATTTTTNLEEVAEKVAIRYQSEMYRSEVTLAQDLVKKGVVDDVLYQNKISPEAYFDALKLDPKLKFISDSAIARGNNPNLEKFFTYSLFWTKKNEVTKAENFIKKGAVNDVLYQNKISPEAYFDALKLNPKLRFYSDSAVTRVNNPNLEKFLSYTSFYNKSQAGKREVAKAEDLIQKGVTDQVLLYNKISPDAYFEALKLNPNLKFIADSAVARKNNPDLEKFYTYATKYYNSLTGK
ncbi:hypothetical protein PPTG_04436 [Phytophthora nicotianae INRA-310]|uniref:RxLR effector protein n=2 Tax=Phytophthora nicotianae TaxID=4792 RepID=W2R0P2_PHYN3|nr:hypothetical protein PPTG_04436 [Phytophthora nicotianae INRA-310]ETN19012.1 hypothetical protein PPTG_04436 [Phytophthora nicotianae INRA-310]KUF87820.1 P-type ATPase (P-ATPase) Superfamily [Phytophthora nicotianae]